MSGTASALAVPESWRSSPDDRRQIPGCTRVREVCGFRVYTINGDDYLSNGTVRSIMRWGDVSHIDPEALEYSSARGSFVDECCRLAEVGDLDWEGTQWEQRFNGVPMRPRPFVEAWEKFRRDTGWQTEAVESFILNPATRTFGYRDRVGHFADAPDKRTIIDLKTSEHIGTSYFLQVANYLDSPHDRGLIVRLDKYGDYHRHWLENAMVMRKRFAVLAQEAHDWIAEQEVIVAALETKRRRYKEFRAKGFR